MKLVLAMLLFVLIIQPWSLLTYAQADDCSSGLPQRLTDSGRGINNTEQGVRIRDSAGGAQIGRLEPSDQFTVTGVVECANNLSWWPITTDAGLSGWIAEGSDGSYFVEPLGVSVNDAPSEEVANTSGGQRNFLTSVELQPTAPIIGGVAQITVDFPAGGGGDSDSNRVIFPEVHFYGEVITLRDFQSFAPSEQVEVTIYAPDGTVYRQETIEAGDGGDGNGYLSLEWQPTVHDLSGIWTVELESETGSVFEYTTRLEAHNTPFVSAFCGPNGYTFMLDGFAADESLTLEMVESTNPYIDGYGDGYEVKSLMSWALNVDERGQLLVHFGAAILRANNRYFVIHDQNGDSWGDRLEMGEQFFNFGACNDVSINIGDTSNTITLYPPYTYGSMLNRNRQDYYEFNAQAGQILDVKMEAVPEDNTSDDLDAMLQLVAPDGTVIAENDDGEGMANDLDAHIANIPLPATGTYTLIAAGNNESQGRYNLILRLDGVGEDAPVVLGAVPAFPRPKGIRITRPASREAAAEWASVWELGEDFKDTTTPIEQDYTATVYYMDFLRVSFTWCADSAARLRDILAPMTLTFRLNEFELPNNVFLQTDSSTCRNWDALLNDFKPDTESVFEIRYSLSEDIFDGYNNYAAGEYIHRILIKAVWEEVE